MTRRDIKALEMLEVHVYKLYARLANELGYSEREYTRLIAKLLAKRLEEEGIEETGSWISSIDGIILSLLVGMPL